MSKYQEDQVQNEWVNMCDKLLTETLIVPVLHL